MALGIVSVTVSVEYKDHDFGKGSARFVTLTAKAPENDPGIPMDDPNELDKLLLTTLDLHQTAWKSLLSQRYATGVINAETFNKQLAAVPKRMQKVRDFLTASAKAAEAE